MIKKKIYRTARIYITAFHAHFVRRDCRVRRECRHSAEWRQCAERCATEIKVGHLKEIISKPDKYLVSLSSKTYVFEDKLSKLLSVWLVISFCVLRLFKRRFVLLLFYVLNIILSLYYIF